MSEENCRRELDLEIPAEEVTKKMEKVAKEFSQRRARARLSPGQSAGLANSASASRKTSKAKCCSSFFPNASKKPSPSKS